MVIFIDAFWCSLCFASMIVVYYVSIEASFIATFYPTIWRIFHIHHASINTAIGHSWSYFIWSYALRKCLKDARFAWYSATYMECKQPTEKRFLTDVLLFTHLVHLPNQMGSPKHQLIFWESGGTCRPMTHASFFATMLPNASVKNISYEYTLCVGSLKLATGYEHLKVCWGRWMSDSSCCRQIRGNQFFWIYALRRFIEISRRLQTFESI